jgi:DNA polymerase-3 subunit gamma/tau
MLGLADRGKIIDLFEEVMKGDMATALTRMKDLYDCGADPVQVLIELAEFIHFLTRLKLVPAAAQDASLSEDERKRGSQFAASLGMPVLTRAWQILSKGFNEVKESGRPLAAADMVLVRLAYAADLPTPDELLRELKGAPVQQAGQRPTVMAPSSALAQKPFEPIAEAGPPARRYQSFADIVALAGERRDIQLKRALEHDVHLVRFEEGAFEFSAGPGASVELAQTLSRKLSEWTGFRWIVALSREKGAPSLKQQADAKTEDALADVRADPLVQSTLKQFPGAEIIAVRKPEPSGHDAPLAIAASEDGSDEIGFDACDVEDEL